MSFFERPVWASFTAVHTTRRAAPVEHIIRGWSQFSSGSWYDTWCGQSIEYSGAEYSHESEGAFEDRSRKWCQRCIQRRERAQRRVPRA